MIDYIALRNFQAHESFRIDFDPHVTCLVGNSDSGKTSILRALMWVALNRPSGVEFLRTGADTVRVELGVDGHKIVRKRSKGKNTYHLDGSSYAAIKTDVPAEISKIINIGPHNYQNALSSPFLFDIPAGQVAKQLNSIIDLGAIDSVLAYVGSAVRKAEAQVTVCEARRAKLKAEKAKLAWVPEMAKRLESLTTQESELQSVADWRSSISSLVMQALKAKESRQRAQEESEASESLLVAWNRLNVLKTRLTALQWIMDQLKKAKTKASPAKLTALETIEQICSSVIDIKRQQKQLMEIIDKIHQEEETRCQNQSRLAEVEKQLSSVKSCPVCQKPM